MWGGGGGRAGGRCGGVGTGGRLGEDFFFNSTQFFPWAISCRYGFGKYPR